MAQSNSVKVVEVCKVAPPPGSIGSAKCPDSLPLTFFDLAWLRFPPVHCLYYYELSNPNTQFSHSLLPKLKHSLSLTLQHYAPFAGNLIWPNDSSIPIISYVKGDAISLTVAESPADFYHLSGTDLCAATACHNLIPQLEISNERDSVAALQITLFPNGGFCIGITTHHAVIDGKSAVLFIKAWAQICKNGGESSLLSSELKPLYDRTIINDPSRFAEIYAKQWEDSHGPNNRSLKVWDFEVPLTESVRGIFDLTRSDIEKLRQLMRTQMTKKKEQHNQAHISTFSLTMAYVWNCLVKAEEIAENKKICLIFGVDCRSRLKPTVPDTYFGNCIAPGITSSVEAKGLLSEEGFLVALNTIGETVKRLENGVLDGAEDWVSGILNDFSGGKIYTIAGSPRFEFHNTDFGMGRAKKVDISSIDRTGAISFMDSRNGDGGIQIGLVLKKHQMEAFASMFTKGLEVV